MKFHLAHTSLPALVLVLAACSGANSAGTEAAATGAGGGDGTGGSGEGASPGGGGSDTTGITVGPTSTSSGGTSSCDSAAEEDRDQDGFTKTQGDCNDCDANVNAGAIEVVITEPGEDGMIPEPADEDCDGMIDNPPPTSCDTGIALESGNAIDGARAIELCKQAAGAADWGVVSAQYMRASGEPVPSSVQFGVQSAFGPNVAPRGGTSMMNLSSGRARLPGQPGSCNSCSCGAASGSTPDDNSFPQTSPQCGGGPGTRRPWPADSA